MEALKGLYHADKLDDQSFISNFTIRLKEYRQVISSLSSQKGKPLQSFLITGKRGMGKSTLLRRIFIEADKEPLNQKMFAVRLGAEQYRLSRLFKLWEEVIDHLQNKIPGIAEQKAALADSKQYEEGLLLIIKDHLLQSGKTLLLLIDNFDQFINKLTTREQHALREALIQYPIQVIGNTIFYDEPFVEYNQPFYDFFKPIRLSNLDKEEAEMFIKMRAEEEGMIGFAEIFEQQKGRISTLRILSGGVPRTLLILLGIISKNNTGDAVDYLHEMIEQVTPLYQDRMKSLSPQQQEIMHYLAMQWDRTPVKDLAAGMRVPSKSISAQLSQLEKSGYINRVNTSNRNNYYEIDERFFNIWLLMSEAAPHDTRRVLWLTKWLDAFYSTEELSDYAQYCYNGKMMTSPSGRFLIAQALSESEKLADNDKLKLVTITSAEIKHVISEAANWEDGIKKKLSQREKNISEYLKQLIDGGKIDESLEEIDKLLKINEPLGLFRKGYLHYKTHDYDNAERYYLMAIEKGQVDAMNNMAILYYYVKKDIVLAERYYLMAIENGHIDAINNLGTFYLQAKKNIALAEYYYQMAFEKGDADAMYNLATLYLQEKKDIALAERYYLMAIDNGNIEAMYNLATLYLQEKKDIALAERYYLMAIDNGNIEAMYNLATLYFQEKRDIALAEHYYLMAVDKGNTMAMNNLAAIYFQEKKDIALAEHYYLMAIDNGSSEAIYNLANLYSQGKKDIALAEQYYLLAIDKGQVDAINNLAVLYHTEKKDISLAEYYYLKAVDIGSSEAMYNLGTMYREVKTDIDLSEKYYLMAVDKGNVDAMYDLATLYLKEKKNIALAEHYYLMAVDKGRLEAMYNLATLYWKEKKDVDLAEKYYLKAIDNGSREAMANLALLHQKERNNIDAAKHYYSRAIDKGHIGAVLNFSELCFSSFDITQKDKVYSLLSENLQIQPGWLVDFVRVKIFLWNGRVKEAEQAMQRMLEEKSVEEFYITLLSGAMQYFLVFKQKHLLHKIFLSGENLVDKYKPVYYALMHEMQDEYPNEFLKMTAELEEPVNQILDFVRAEQKRLGIS